MDSPTTTELQEAAERAAKGIRDREVMKRASERLDRAREATRKEKGIVEVAVELIREVRDE
jgi:hypothetical protein